MRLYRLAISILFLPALLAAASGPDSRQPTDPTSVTSPANPSAQPISIADLFYSRQIVPGSWSPDGHEIVFSTNITGRLNLWKVNSAGGWPIQLSQSDDRQDRASFSPDGKWIVYQQDVGGGEIYDIYKINSDGGPAVNLTKTPEISEDDPTFSPKGDLLGFELKPKTASASDVAVLDWNTGSVRNLSNEKTKDHVWILRAWSPDGRYIYADRFLAAFTDSDIYRIDLQTGALENLTPHQGQIIYSAASVSPDGRTLLISDNAKGGFNNVALLDTATKKITPVTDTQWEAAAEDFSPDGKSFTYSLNQDGRTATYLADTATLQSRKLNMPEGITEPVGHPTGYSPDGHSVLITHQSSQRVNDIWVYDLNSSQPRQLTYSAIASLSPRDLPPSQLIHYKSFDGKIISAFLWVPYNLKRDASNPAVVIPHGGPTGQTADSFNRTVAALASRGYVCIAPNVRGSTGYGIAFQKANFQDLGGGDLQDEVYAAHFLVDTGFVDAKKIGITGGSYGGYMTLMALGKTPDVWAAAVERYGIINWFTMLQHEDPFLQEYEKTLLGDPVKDRTVYENASPIKYLRDAKAPLLVLQGENDIRVPKEEAEQIVKILQDAGKTVEFHYYAAEGHGFAKRENQIDAIQRMVAFFDKYLKGSLTPSVSAH